jgi:hypothetical protein
MRTVSILEERTGSLEAARIEMESHTKHELVAKYRVPLDTVSRWEHRLGFRCKRRCMSCHATKPYADMYLDSVGRVTAVTKCRSCGERGRKARHEDKLVIRRSNEPEFLEVHESFFQLTRRPISAATGRVHYWPQGISNDEL